MPIPDIGIILANPRQIGGNAWETAVLKAFLVVHVNDYDSVEFEVPLGPALDLGPLVPAYVQRCATASSRKRADMICWREGVPTIVEAKERVDGGALGQLLVYSRLLREDKPTLQQIYKIAVGASAVIGIEDILFSYGVLVEVFPWARPASAT